MNSLTFEYEIPREEYVAASRLYYRLKTDRRGRLWRSLRAIWWVSAGIILILLGCREAASDLVSLVLVIIGAWWAYAGMASFFHRAYYGRAYRRSGLAGQRYKVDLNEEGFEVSGEMLAWRVKWPGVKFKGEDELAFVLVSAGTVFIFGKKYLDAGQQQELRRLSGLATL